MMDNQPFPPQQKQKQSTFGVYVDFIFANIRLITEPAQIIMSILAGDSGSAMRGFNNFVRLEGKKDILRFYIIYIIAPVLFSFLIFGFGDNYGIESLRIALVIMWPLLLSRMLFEAFDPHYGQVEMVMFAFEFLENPFLIGARYYLHLKYNLTDLDPSQFGLYHAGFFILIHALKALYLKEKLEVKYGDTLIGPKRALKLLFLRMNYSHGIHNQNTNEGQPSYKNIESEPENDSNNDLDK